MRKLLLASAAMVALGGPALAADAVPPPPVPAPPVVAVPEPAGFNWTGPYVGFYAGYGLGRSSATAETAGGFDDAAGTALTVDPRGLFGGVTVGYNYQAGAFVFGVEGTGGYLNLNGTNFSADPPGDGDDVGTVRYGWYGTLAARLGVAVDRTLLFATAGGVLTQIDTLYGDLAGAPPVIDPADATALTGGQFGYVLGGGAEFAFDNNWTARLEYNFLNLGADTTANQQDDTFTQRNSAHLVRFGLNYLFNY